MFEKHDIEINNEAKFYSGLAVLVSFLASFTVTSPIVTFAIAFNAIIFMQFIKGIRRDRRIVAATLAIGLIIIISDRAMDGDLFFRYRTDLVFEVFFIGLAVFYSAGDMKKVKGALVAALISSSIIFLLHKNVYADMVVKDWHLNKSIRKEVQKEYKVSKMTEKEVGSLESVYIPRHYKIRSLEGIGRLKSLRFLRLKNPKYIEDFGPIKELENLKFLHVYQADSVDFSRFGRLENIESLHIHDCTSQISIDGSNYPNLVWIEFTDGKLKDLNGLENMEKIDTLFLWWMEIDSLDGIEKMESLRMIDFQNVKIKDSSSFNELENLEEVYIGESEIKGIELIEETYKDIIKIE